MISRNIPLLAGSQVLAVSGSAGVVLVGGLIGVELAPLLDLATLPVSVAVVGTALATIPAALLMQRIGRRRGFIAAGYLGPDIARRTGDWLPVAYAGSFLGLGALYAMAILLLVWLRDVTPEQGAAEAETSGEARPLRRIVLSPTFLVAVLAGAVAYGVMSFIVPDDFDDPLPESTLPA
jgi:MFS family permease